MQINVAQLLKAPVGTTRHYQVNGTVTGISDGDEQPVEGEVTLIRTPRSILAEGSFRTEVTLACSRCLEAFTRPLLLEIKEEYSPTVDVNTGLLLPPSGESGAFTINANHILDLTEALRQYGVMALPMKPLCREDCAGICPDCGCDLNLEQCDCRRQKDPRRSELASLRDKKT